MKIPVTSWVLLVAFLLLGGLMVLLTNDPVVATPVRLVAVGIWGAICLVFGLYDFVLAKNAKPGRTSSIDSTPFDRWTIPHGGAGIVFGIWLVPLVWFALLVVAWEFFEVYVPGFGEEEIIWNRVVDVGIALVLWFVVVLIIMAVKSVPFPLV